MLAARELIRSVWRGLPPIAFPVVMPKYMEKADSMSPGQSQARLVPNVIDDRTCINVYDQQNLDNFRYGEIRVR